MRAHLGDLPPTEVGKALERERQDVGRPVDGEPLAGWNLPFASARKGRGRAIGLCSEDSCPHTGLFSSSFSAIRVVSSVYLRLLIFLPVILIPACASSSPAFLMMYSA